MTRLFPPSADRPIGRSIGGPVRRRMVRLVVRRMVGLFAVAATVAATVLLLGGVGTAVAAAGPAAEDPPPLVFPSGVPGPAEVLGEDADQVRAPAGPVFDVDPDSPGTSLGTPRSPGATGPSGAGSGKPASEPSPRSSGEVAVPLAALRTVNKTPEVPTWLLLLAAVPLAAVLMDATRVPASWRALGPRRLQPEEPSAAEEVQ